jgi:hypothetical protein
MSPFGESLLVSIPGAALDRLALPGSLFGWDTLRDAVLPPSLHVALRLVVRHCEKEGVALRFIARPEIFTHGAARAWLDARLDAARDHLALTDGRTLNAIPGLRNHAFFHARGEAAAEAALARLLAVAPELVGGLAGQVNGTLAARCGGRWARPPCLVLRLDTAAPSDPGLHAPFRLLPGGPERNAAASAESALPPDAAPPGPRPPRYVPLSEVALDDPGFVLELARMIQHAALGGEPLLLGLPATGETLAARIAPVLSALAASRAVLPRAPGWAVRFTSADPSAAELQGAALTLHPGTDFWRLDLAQRQALGEVRVAGSGSLQAFARLVGAWLGREVAIQRPPVPAMKVVAP